MSVFSSLENEKLDRNQMKQITGGNDLNFCMTSYSYNGFVGCRNASGSVEGCMCLQSCNPALLPGVNCNA